jgi:tetratricopeptide (TPR) repeat protein
MACRHLQVPMVGLLIMIGTTVTILAPHVRHGRVVFMALSIAWLAACGIESVVQRPLWHDAISHSSAVVRHNPESMIRVNGHAVCLERYGAPDDEVERWFQRAVELSPTFPERAGVVFHDYGRFLLKRRYDVAARELLSRSVDLTNDPADKDYDSCRINRAIAMTRLGDAAEAVATIEELHRRRPASVASWVTLGNAQAVRGAWPEAAVAYGNATELDPNDVVVLCDAAKASFRAGDSEAARRYLTRATMVNPDAAAVREACELIGD